MGHCKQANHLFFVCVLFVRSLFPFSNWFWQSYDNMVICNMVLPNCRTQKARALRTPARCGPGPHPLVLYSVCAFVCAFRAILCCLLFSKQRLIACSTHSALFLCVLVRSFDVLSEIDFFCAVFLFFYLADWLSVWVFVSNILTPYIICLFFFNTIHNELELWKEVEGVNRDNGFCVKYMTPGHVARPNIP